MAVDAFKLAPVVEPDGLESIAPAARQDRYVVHVKDLVVTALIGIYDHEKVTPQRVRISVDLSLRYPARGFGEDYSRVYCYETLINRIKERALGGHIHLVETLADQIADICLEDPRAFTVSVKCEKLDVFDDSESVGITIERSRIEPAPV